MTRARGALAVALIAGAAACSTFDPEPSPVCPTGCAPGAIARAWATTGEGRVRIESVAVDAFGELVLAGEFELTLALPPYLTRVAFAHDAFIVRVPLAGDIIEAVTLARDDTSLHGVVPDHEGNVVALTTASDLTMYAHLTLPATSLVDTALFASSAPPVVVAAGDRHGRAIVAISAPDLTLGETLAGAHGLIVRLDQGPRPTVLVDWPDTVIRDLAIGPTGDLIVVGDYAGEVPGFLACSRRCAFVARLAADGRLDPDRAIGWAYAYEATVDSAFTSVAVGRDGAVIALGFNESPLVLARFAYEGGAGLPLELAPATTAVTARHVAIGADGTAYVAVTYRGTVTVGDRELPSQAAAPRHDTAVAAIAADGALRWARRLGGTGTITAADLTIAKGYPVLAGEYDGTFPTEALDAPVPPVASGVEGFAIMLAP